MKVAYSFDNESYSCCYDTEEEAIADALKEIESILKYNPECAPVCVYIGDCEFFKPSLSGSSWDIIEAAICQADDEGFGEWADDYLSDVKKEHMEELEEGLEKVFQEWIEKYNYHATFYKVNSYSIYRYDKEKHKLYKTDEGSGREWVRKKESESLQDLCRKHLPKLVLHTQLKPERIWFCLIHR